MNVKVIGVPVCDNSSIFRERVDEYVKEFNEMEHKTLEIDQYQMWDGYVGEGYSIPYKEQIELMKELAVSEGILLDPVYTGKAFYALVDQIGKHFFPPNSHILFIHTGGIFGLLAQTNNFV